MAILAYRFGVFELDLRREEFCKQGRTIRLQDQPRQVLAALLQRPGEVITRAELRERLWPGDTFVDFEHGLNTAVNRLREALGDAAGNPRFIETVPRRGYRFIAPVEVVSEPEPVLPEPEAVGHERLPADPAAPRKHWWLAIVIAVTLLALGTVYLISQDTIPWRHVPPSRGRMMLAVLPFENLSGDPDQEHFSDGLTEEMMTQLGQLQPDRLGVIARTSALRYKQTPKEPAQIGRELGVSYLVGGSVRRAGGRVRITAKLIQVSDQTHLWAKTYEGDLRDVLTLQRQVATTIAEEIEIKLTPPQARLRAPAPIDPDVYEVYLRGRYFWNRRTRDGLRKAIDYFQQVIRAEPRYALAYVGLADCYNLLADYGAVAPKEAIPAAKAAALKALEIEERLAEAHASLGWARLVYDWDWSGAEREFRRSLELNPGYASAHQWYAYHLRTLGRHEEALAEARQAQQLDPLSLIIHAIIGWHYYLGRDYDRAIGQFRKTIEMDPNFARVHSYLGWAYLQKGMHSQAIEELQKARALFGENPARLAELAYAYAVAGRTTDARKALEELNQLSKRTYIASDLMAHIYAGLQETERALDYLERTYQERAVKLVLLKVDPRFDPVRAHPRFAELVRRVGFPE
jgi:TolB-like protein/DNA-binding winged helix-turn-helix (wHTH) protein/Flp pilus assembly protein TadD